MNGIQFNLGDIVIENNDYVIVDDIYLLKHELQNFILNDPVSCSWDLNHGLDRKIIFSNNKDAIRDEVRNKIIRYYNNRVTDVYDIKVAINQNKIKVDCKIDTIYGKLEFRSEGRL